MVRVLIPSQLQSYCGGTSRLEAEGATVEAVFDDLDRRFPGLKFRVIDEQDRVRPHMRVFISGRGTRNVRDSLADGDELMIFGALSGG